ncbi:MAG: hypothetical protein KDD34_04260 [Bdellovibrionales bacterium]|nr:hypothetical protein [Bdellovibrionales bacterium]
MTHFGHCPACNQQIPQERYFNDSVICECGWNRSLKAKAVSAKQTDRTCIAIFIFAALLIGSFIQAVNWDKYFFTIIPLKTQQVLGMASAQQLTKIADICMERKKYTCAEQAYADAYKKEPTNLTHLEKLGELQVKQELMLSATKTYDLYFGANGNSFEAKYNYAKALAATNNTEKAEKYFKEVLNAKPDTLQITVTRHYINMLVKNDELTKAKRVIEHFRKQGSNTGLFMDKEYKEIKDKLSHKVASF